MLSAVKEACRFWAAAAAKPGGSARGLCSPIRHPSQLAGLPCLLPRTPCPNPLAVLMDWVPRRLRGRVAAVDSVRSFSWSGSAALGGFLIQRYGFQRTFLITAAIKAAAFAPLLVLLAFVPDGICVPAGARAARLRLQQRARQEEPAHGAQLGGGRQAQARHGGAGRQQHSGMAGRQ